MSEFSVGQRVRIKTPVLFGTKVVAFGEIVEVIEPESDANVFFVGVAEGQTLKDPFFAEELVDANELTPTAPVFKINDRVRVLTWYDPQEVGVIKHIDAEQPTPYHVEFDDEEYTVVRASSLTLVEHAAIALRQLGDTE